MKSIIGTTFCILLAAIVICPAVLIVAISWLAGVGSETHFHGFHGYEGR